MITRQFVLYIAEHNKLIIMWSTVRLDTTHPTPLLVNVYPALWVAKDAQAHPTVKYANHPTSYSTTHVSAHVHQDI
jgi:hypothetical protein